MLGTEIAIAWFPHFKKKHEWHQNNLVKYARSCCKHFGGASKITLNQILKLQGSERRPWGVTNSPIPSHAVYAFQNSSVTPRTLFAVLEVARNANDACCARHHATLSVHARSEY